MNPSQLPCQGNFRYVSRMNLLLLYPSDQRDDGSFVVGDHRAEHIREVLKVGQGDSLAVGLVNGPVGVGLIESVSAEEVVVRVGEWRGPSQYQTAIDLLLAIPRPKTLRKVLVTCGMMGVRSLHLTRAYRTEKSYLLSPLLRPEEYTQYLLDGMAQGEFTRMPEVHVHHLFRPFVEDGIPQLPDYRTALKMMPDLLPASTMDKVITQPFPSHIMLAIGPEGGWVPFERELLQQAGFTPTNLGPWTLRVETAVAVALGQVELLRQMGV